MHDQSASVFRELENLLVDPATTDFDDPDVALGVVGTDVDVMGVVHDGVPPCPPLCDVSVCIHDHDVVCAARPLRPVYVRRPPPRNFAVSPRADDYPIRVVDGTTSQLPQVQVSSWSGSDYGNGVLVRQALSTRSKLFASTCAVRRRLRERKLKFGILVHGSDASQRASMPLGAR